MKYFAGAEWEERTASGPLLGTSGDPDTQHSFHTGGARAPEFLVALAGSHPFCLMSAKSPVPQRWPQEAGRGSGLRWVCGR